MGYKKIPINEPKEIRALLNPSLILSQSLRTDQRSVEFSFELHGRWFNFRSLTKEITKIITTGSNRDHEEKWGLLLQKLKAGIKEGEMLVREEFVPTGIQKSLFFLRRAIAGNPPYNELLYSRLELEVRNLANLLKIVSKSNQ